MSNNIQYYQNMHYQVNRTDQAWENGLKPPFRMLGSFQMHFCNLLMILHGLVPLPKCAKAFSTFTICNIKSIQLTKLKIMAKNLIFGTLDHSKMLFWDCWMILHHLVVLLNGEIHIVLSSYAISSQSNRPNSR